MWTWVWLRKCKKKIQQWKRKLGFSEAKAREDDFSLDNGGRILEKLITSFDGKRNPIRIFSKQELQTATNGYDQNEILHKGMTHVLYKGNYEGRVIAVKKSTASARSTDNYIKDAYINEVVVASQISNHKNILKLLGCCVETETPTLVFEFAGYKDLFEHIFEDHRPLPWESRLKIATEVANAVAYLHMGTSRPIIHRAIASRNIFLDHDCVAKLFEFGFSVPIPLGETHVDAEVVGRAGFIAPESHAIGRFTEKSDVYSFGAVLFEILTGERAWNLFAHVFVPRANLSGSATPTNHVYNWNEIDEDTAAYLKANMLKEGNRRQLMECVELALRCLQMKAEERPTMKEVAQTLRLIKRRQEILHF